jgi:TRAP-type C4-dicarboxylate transport system permease small subunit
MERMVNWLEKIERWLLVTVFSVLVLSGLLQLLMRNLFDTGLLWNDAFNKAVLLWLALLGALSATKNNQHIKIDLFNRLITKHWRHYWNCFVSLIAGAICAMVSYFSAQFVLEEMTYGDIAFAVVPLWLVQAAIPVIFALMALRFLLHLFNEPAREHHS